jgi:hypothetical protein
VTFTDLETALILVTVFGVTYSALWWLVDRLPYRRRVDRLDVRDRVARGVVRTIDGGEAAVRIYDNDPASAGERGRVVSEPNTDRNSA